MLPTSFALAEWGIKIHGILAMDSCISSWTAKQPDEDLEFSFLNTIKGVIESAAPLPPSAYKSESCKSRVCNKTIILKYLMSCLYGKCDRIECILKIAAAVFLKHKSGWLLMEMRTQRTRMGKRMLHLTLTGAINPPSQSTCRDLARFALVVLLRQLSLGPGMQLMSSPRQTLSQMALTETHIKENATWHTEQWLARFISHKWEGINGMRGGLSHCVPHCVMLLPEILWKAHQKEGIHLVIGTALLASRPGRDKSGTLWHYQERTMTWK